MNTEVISDLLQGSNQYHLAIPQTISLSVCMWEDKRIRNKNMPQTKINKAKGSMKL